jgi:hypothetical protein
MDISAIFQSLGRVGKNVVNGAVYKIFFPGHPCLGRNVPVHADIALLHAVAQKNQGLCYQLGQIDLLRAKQFGAGIIKKIGDCGGQAARLVMNGL